MKNTRFILFAAALAALFAACKQDGSKQGQGGDAASTAQALAGDWIALDFCSRANQYGSVLEAMTYSHVPYAYALTFSPEKPDSVICFNGIEQWTLPVKYRQDTLEVVGARPGKSIYLLYHSQGQKNMTMFDGTTGQMYMDNFIKSNAEVDNGYLAFIIALNHHMFEGRFWPVGKVPDLTKDHVQFTPGGYVLNWLLYDRYEVCTAGDCFLAANDVDIIVLSKHSKPDEKHYFGFRFSAQNDTLSILNLVNTNPEEKGMHKVKSTAYQFVRK